MWHYGSGWCTPPPRIEINMNAIEKNWGQQVHFTNLPPSPPSLHTYISSLWNTLKRKPLFQIQLEIWVNMTLLYWLMYPPPPTLEKLDFTGFTTFPIFSHRSGSEWLGWPILPDSQLSQSFPTEVAQNDSEWPILPDSQLFQSFPFSQWCSISFNGKTVWSDGSQNKYDSGLAVEKIRLVSLSVTWPISGTYWST